MYANPLNTLFEMAPLFIVFPIIYLIIREILDYSTRKNIIAKGLEGEEAKKLFKATMRTQTPSSMKWGLILVFVGLTMVIVTAINNMADEIKIGLTLISAGIGLLVFYFMAAKKLHENQQKEL
jgi:hypothetical protein